MQENTRWRHYIAIPYHLLLLIKTTECLPNIVLKHDICILMTRRDANIIVDDASDTCSLNYANIINRLAIRRRARLRL